MKLNIKYTALFFSLFFLFSVSMSFMYPPKERDIIDTKDYTDYQSGIFMAYESLSKNYNDLDCFIAVYKNEILGWFGKSKNIESSYYIVTYDDDSNVYYEHYFLYLFPKYLSYIFICLIFYFWIRTLKQ